jgi:L-ascorbate metabolism protein UlaG (beta-lactamase superfamily)
MFRFSPIPTAGAARVVFPLPLTNERCLEPRMDISWYGLSCFRIREAGVTVVCDPFDKSVGLALPKLKADIVTVSHDRPGHNAAERVVGEGKLLRGPGEYEVHNVFVSGLATYHRKRKGGELERNIAYFFEFGDLTVGHLGDIGEIPDKSEMEALNVGEVDVLIVPVGGGDTLDPARAVEVISMLEPRLVVPMHYQHAGLVSTLAEKLEPVEKFLKEFGVSAPDRQETLRLTKSNLPDETQVVLLNISQ